MAFTFMLRSRVLGALTLCCSFLSVVWLDQQHQVSVFGQTKLECFPVHEYTTLAHSSAVLAAGLGWYDVNLINTEWEEPTMVAPKLASTKTRCLGFIDVADADTN